MPKRLSSCSHAPWISDCAEQKNGTHCAAGWLDTKAAFPLLRNLSRATLENRKTLSWLIFVGDSDTRGLVFLLLQHLAASSYTQAVAAVNKRLWLGDHLSGSRVCHFDWRYDAQGRVMATRTVPCLSKRSMSTTSKTMGDYARLGDNYSLNDDAQGQSDWALRVTYLGTSTHSSTSNVLEALKSELSRTRTVPTLVYASFAAWAKKACNSSHQLDPSTDPSPRALATQLNIVAKYVQPHGGRGRQLYWGSLLGMANRGPKANTPGACEFDAQMRAELGEHWYAFSRDTLLSRRSGLAGAHGVRRSDGHAPHLINLVDLQRLLRAISLNNRPPVAGFSLNRDECVLPRVLSYTNECAGVLTRQESSLGFIAAQSLYCNHSATPNVFL